MHGATIQIVEKEVERGSPQVTMSHGAEKMRCACRVGKARRQTHFRKVKNYYFYMATVVTRTRCSVTLYVHFLSCNTVYVGQRT